MSIETTTDIFSVAIGSSKAVVREKRVPGRQYAEKLIPIIKEILGEEELTAGDLRALGVGVGPGYFTGIRVGVSCAITMAQILKIPVYGISSMDLSGKYVEHPVIKAFRDKYYYAEYDSRGCRKTPFKIIDLEEKEKTGSVEAEISAAYMLKEIDDRYKKKTEGDWRKIKPIYVMDTVYRSKFDKNENRREKILK